MEKKITIFDVEMDCITAKEAMLRILEYMENDALDTVELLSMSTLLEQRENQQWKEDVDRINMVIPAEAEILEAALVKDKVLLREAQGRSFLKLFMQYLQKNQKRVFLLAESEEEIRKVSERISWYNRGVKIVGSGVASEESVDGIINEINGMGVECILSVLPAPYQESFIRRNRPLLDAKIWLGCGGSLRMSYDERKVFSRLKRIFTKKMFHYRVGQQR